MSHTNSPEERLRELDRALDSPDREALLRAALNDESTLVREHAIALAARYLQPEILGELIRDEANAVLRNAAQSALERQGPYAADHLITLTRDHDADVALFAVQVLSKICLPSTEGALLPLVDHPDPNIAQAAIEAMGALASRAAVPRLLRLLDSDPWLQFAAVTALGQIGDAGAVEPLLAHIGDELLAEAIVDALGQIGAPEALLPLMEAMRAGDRLPLRDRVLLAVAAIIEKEALPPDIAANLRRCTEDARELNDYLRLVLELDDRALAHAAVVLTLAGGIAPLLPAVFIRACECSDDAAAIASACDRFRGTLRPQLAGLLAHADMRVRKGALLAAPLDSAARETALDFLDDDNPRVRIAACTALTRAPSEKAIPRLAHLLLQGAPDEREAAVEALAHCPGEQLEPVLPGLDDDVPDETQVACLRALAGARSLLARERVQRLLASDALAVRRAALRVLANHPGSLFIEVATRCLDAEDTALGPDVVEHLSRTSCAAASELLLGRLDRSTELRYHIIRALGRLGSPGAATPLIAIYPGCTRHERIEVATALVHIGTAECGVFLETLLASSDGDLRRVAADGVARLAAPRHVSVLMQLAADPDWVVRNHAAWGLGRLGNPASRATLLTLARDVTPVVARAARAALAKLDAATEGQG